MKNNVAIITGGAGHVGRAVSTKLAEQGVNLIILDKNIKNEDSFTKELKQRFDIDILCVNVDLIEPEVFSSVRETVQNEFDRLDYVINNAAFYDDMPGWGVSYEKEGYEAWLKVMRVNLLAPFFLLQSLTPLLSKSVNASVVNVSSIYGLVGPNHSLYDDTEMTNPAAYAASKGGLIQLTRWLSTVLSPDIRVNSVTPGGIERGQAEVFVERYKKCTPLARMAIEEDIAGAILFLLSSDSSYITGHNLVVDGGWTAW